MRARSALFTLFGDVVRPSGGEAWLVTLTECMGTIGFTPEATRTALHRMSAEGWVEPRRVGRYAAYRLTARGVDRLNEAAERIYGLRARSWDGRWRILIGEALDRDADLRRELSWMGFGELREAVWISPHDHGERLQHTLDGHGARGLLRLVAEAEGDARDVAERAWDLADLSASYEEFARQWRATPVPDTSREAFAHRITLVHEWRKFLFLDPGLPAVLLRDGWPGHEAARTFRERYSRVADLAWLYYDDLAASAPGSDGHPPVRTPAADDPFARGLRALEA